MSKEKFDKDGFDSTPYGGFGLLDPSFDDESYWARLRFRVMTRAADELFRRRIAADVSVVGVMEGWSRTLMPVAAMAALLAGFILFSDYRAASGPADVEEILLADLDDLVRPLADESAGPVVRFALEGF